jgi:hypothetical protein
MRPGPVDVHTAAGRPPHTRSSLRSTDDGQRYRLLRTHRWDDEVAARMRADRGR